MSNRLGVKMSELAARSGVSGSTIKHYIREGLLPDSAVRTSKNMAWYDEQLVERIIAIKQLQKTHYLPLKVIKEILSKPATGSRDTFLGLQAGLAALDTLGARSLDELQEEGLDESDWADLKTLGLVAADDERVQGQDLELVKLLVLARKRGFTKKVLPVSVLKEYQTAVEALVRFEWRILTTTVQRAPAHENKALAQESVSLGEALVSTLRRRLLLPVMGQMHPDLNHSNRDVNET